MTEKQYLMLSGRFEDTEFIGNSTMVIGVPFDAPEEFKRRVWAAAQSYVVGNRSNETRVRVHFSLDGTGPGAQ